MKKQNALLWMLRRNRRRLPMLLFYTLLQIAASALSVLFALGMRSVIDCATNGTTDQLVRSVIVLAAMILTVLLIAALSKEIKMRMAMELDRDRKRALLHHLLHAEYRQVSTYHSGELLNRMNADVRAVNEAMITLIPGVLSILTKLAAALIVLAELDGRFALVVLAGGVFVVLLTALVRDRLKELHKKVSEANGKLSGFLQESMEKLLMVQAMDVAVQMEHRADVLMAERYRLQKITKNINLASGLGVSFLSFGAAFLALIWCAFGLHRGTMTFGTLTAVTQLVGQLRGPFFSLSGILPKYAAFCASAERLMELEQIPPGRENIRTDALPVYEKMRCIEGRNVTFAYEADNVLQSASFCLPKGSFTMVVGPSGIGKSTLLKLLLGVLRQEEGSLSICTDAETIPTCEAPKGFFTYVPQGNLLLSGTVRENLLLTCPDAGQAEIGQAVYASAMDSFVEQLPQGLETKLGENAMGLSEGQAQRLAIARAVLSGAPVLLLDEATSALDAETEETVLRRLKALPDKTCIVVTHRPAAERVCDLRLEITGTGSMRLTPCGDHGSRDEISKGQ